MSSLFLVGSLSIGGVYHLADGKRVGCGPAVGSGEWVIEVPAESVDASASRLSNYFFPHCVKRHTVEIGGFAEFKRTKVPGSLRWDMHLLTVTTSGGAFPFP